MTVTSAADSDRRPSRSDEGSQLHPVIGVLALQGDVEEHVVLLESLDVAVKEVRVGDDLDQIDAIVIPGGESTTLQLLIDAAGIRHELDRRIAAGMAAFGTCAGMILLARAVIDGRPDQWSFGAIDLTVRRNAYGRQAESFETDIELVGADSGSMHAVFIRAPIVEDVGDGVEVLAQLNVEGRQPLPVACHQGRVTVAAFHPELVGDRRLHELFVKDARAAISARITGG